MDSLYALRRTLHVVNGTDPSRHHSGNAPSSSSSSSSYSTLSSRLRGSGSGGHKGGGGASSASASSPSPVTVVAVAGKTVARHRLLALLLSNGQLALQYASTDGSEPLVRHIPWPATANGAGGVGVDAAAAASARRRGVVAMCLDPGAEWLTCVLRDGCLLCIPVLAAMSPDSPPRLRPPLGSITRMRALPAIKGLAGKVTCCTWWTGGVGTGRTHYCVVGTQTPGLTFVDMATGTARATVRLRAAPRTVEVVCDESENVEYLIVQADRPLRVLLRHEVVWEDEPVTETIIEAAKRPAFTPTALQRFDTTSPSSRGTLSVVRARGAAAVTYLSLSPKGGTTSLAVHGPSLNQHPLFVYQMPPGCRESCLTDNVIFTHSGDGTLAAISRYLAGSAAATTSAPELSQLDGRAVLQTFKLPPGEEILGLFTRPGASVASGETPSDPLGGCCIVTTAGVHECISKGAPERLFHDILRNGGDPEPLAATLHLDVNSLYQSAAEERYACGKVSAAMELYLLAQTPHDELLSRFAGDGHLWLITNYLRYQLRNAGALDFRSRKRMANLLLLCYVRQLLLAESPDALAAPGAAEAGVDRNRSGGPGKMGIERSGWSSPLRRPRGGSIESTASNRSGRSSSFHFGSGGGGVGSGVTGLGSAAVATAAGAALSPPPASGASGVECAGDTNFAAEMPLAELRADFDSFITDNWDYDAPAAMLALLRNGMLVRFFRVAQTRRLVSQAVNMPIRHGAPRLPNAALDYLLRRGHADMVCNAADGLLLRCMSPEDAVRFVTARPAGVVQCIAVATPLLPQLSEEALLRLARHFDPSRKLVRGLFAKARDGGLSRNSVSSLIRERGRARGRKNSLVGMDSDRAIGSERTDAGGSGTSADGGGGGVNRSDTEEEAQPVLEEVTEMFLAVLVALSNLRRSRGLDTIRPELHCPWILDPCAALDYAVRPDQFGAGTNQYHQNQRYSGMHSSQRSSAQGQVGDVLATGVATDETLSCGSHHGALVAAGELWTWGRAQGGRLGQGDIMEQEDRLPPLRVEHLSMFSIVVQGVACGAEHTVVRTERGVYTFGTNAFGQLGVGDTERRTTPAAVAELQDQSVLRVACGYHHSFALTESGLLWAWGWGQHGQLGLQRCEDVLLPTRVRALDGLAPVQVAGGYCHSVVLTTRGQVYTFGSGVFGQLGRGSLGKQTIPRLVDAHGEDPIRFVACGAFQTFSLSVKGTLYFCGRSLFEATADWDGAGENRAQKLTQRSGGGKNNDSIVLVPRPVDLPFSASLVTQVAVAQRHALLLLADGRVATYGTGDYGQLGHGGTADAKTPRVVTTVKGSIEPGRVAVGSAFCAVVDKSGQTWAWGRASSGELGGGGGVETDASSFSATPRALLELPLSPLSRSSSFDSTSGNEGSSAAAANANTKSVTAFPSTTIATASTAATIGSTMKKTIGPSDSGSKGGDIDSISGGASNPLPSMPDFGSTTVPYGGWSLPLALSALRGHYPVTNLLRRFEDWAEHDGLAHVHLLLGNYSSSLEARLTALESFSARGGTLPTLDTDLESDTGVDASPLMRHAAVLVDAYLGAFDERLQTFSSPHNCGGGSTQQLPVSTTKAEDTVADVEQAVLTSLRFWHSHDWPETHLRAIFERHAATVSRPLMALVSRMAESTSLTSTTLLKTRNNNLSDPLAVPQLLAQFPLDFFLNLTEVCLLASSNECRTVTSNNVSSGADASAAAATVSGAGGGASGGSAAAVSGSSPDTPSLQRLWSGVMDNLAKDTSDRKSLHLAHMPMSESLTRSRRSTMQTPTVTAIAAAAAGASASVFSYDRDADEEGMVESVATAMAFTCGHSFTRSAFLDKVLPEFRSRLEALPADLSVWTAFTLQEYSRQRPSLACPYCVFAAVRRRIASSHPSNQVPVWAL